jgi:mRNA-degrading endonuclease toxin of MazEF toxin-antitoxin module
VASRGQIWLVDLDPTRGHEQRGRQPPLVVSTATPGELVRAVSTGRLVECWGTVERQTLALVEDRLRILLQL